MRDDENSLVEKSKMGEREIRYREALNEALREEMRRDPLVFCFGEGVAERGGSFLVTSGLLEEFGPQRVLDTPISEMAIAGGCVGAAIVGARPVGEILFIDFMTLTMDMVVNQAAKYNFMTGGNGKVPMVLRTQGGCGKGLAAQHSQSLEAWFFHIPGLKVVMPSTPYDAKGLLKSAIRDDDPVIFIEHKRLYAQKGVVPEEEYLIPIGKGNIKRAGKDVTVFAYSLMVDVALAAAAELAKEGVEVEIIDPRSLVPMDYDLILESVKKTGRLVIVQEACRRGGVGAEIAAFVAENAFDYLDAPIVRAAGLNLPIPYNIHLQELCIPRPEDVITAIKKVL